MAKEAVQTHITVDFNELEPQQLDDLVKAGTKEAGRIPHMKAQGLQIITGMAERAGKELSPEVRAQQVVEVPVEQYNLMAAILGWELMELAQDAFQPEQPFNDIDFEV